MTDKREYYEESDKCAIAAAEELELFLELSEAEVVEFSRLFLTKLQEAQAPHD